MFNKHKWTIAAIIMGSIIGAVFMLLALGYIPGGHNAGNDATNTSSSSIVDNSQPYGQDRNYLQDNIAGSRQNAIVRAARKVGPAVVSLSVIQVVQTRNNTPFGSDFWDFFFQPPPARERQVMSLGSGVIINPRGYVLTNDHVVDGAKEIRVTLENGDEYRGRLLGADPVSDLAVVKIQSDTTEFSTAPLGNSDDLIIGEWAIAIGNPFGYLLDDPQPTVTVGVISANKRDIKPERGQRATYRKMIQTDAAINPGNSGGPLVNAAGEVIGINTFIFSSSRGSEGIGFAVPINRAKAVIDDILKYGEVVKAWIGLDVQSITPDLAKRFNLDRSKGVIVSYVNNDSPAERAGLKPGDMLLSVGRFTIENAGDWEEIANYARVGRALPVQAQRGDMRLSVVVLPEEIPTRQAPRKTDKFGLEVAEITPSVANYLGLRDRTGVLVMGAREDKQAYNWGLQPGDIIHQIGKFEINNLSDYINTISKVEHGYRVVFTVERGGEIFFLQVIT